MESIAHLFLQSEVATRIWRCFGDIFRLPYQFASVAHAIAIWMPKTASQTQFDHCKAYKIAWIFRKLWVARCAATFEDIPMNARQIARRVISRVQLHSLIFTPKKTSTIIQRNILGIWGIDHKQLQVKCGTWCKWDAPSPEWFKLNIDGSARSEICTGGGILRDSHSNMVMAFSSFYGSGYNNFAEFAALRDGLSMCRALGVTQLMVESDSMVVVNAIRGRRVTSWSLEYIFRQCLAALSTPLSIERIFIQKNMVADRLANWAHEHKQSMEIFMARELPKQIWRYLIADHHGISYVRC